MVFSASQINFHDWLIRDYISTWILRYSICTQYPPSSWPWSYDSWIYNYLGNLCLQSSFKWSVSVCGYKKDGRLFQVSTVPWVNKYFLTSSLECVLYNNHNRIMKDMIMYIILHIILTKSRKFREIIRNFIHLVRHPIMLPWLLLEKRPKTQNEWRNICWLYTLSYLFLLIIYVIISFFVDYIHYHIFFCWLYTLSYYILCLLKAISKKSIYWFEVHCHSLTRKSKSRGKWMKTKYNKKQ
jgi:hypothetical protein